MTHQVDNVVDGLLAGGAATFPWWMSYLSTGGTILAIVIGIAVGVIRLMTGINHWKHSKNILKEDAIGKPKE